MSSKSGKDQKSFSANSSLAETCAFRVSASFHLCTLVFSMEPGYFPWDTWCVFV